MRGVTVSKKDEMIAGQRLRPRRNNSVSSATLKVTQ